MKSPSTQPPKSSSQKPAVAELFSPIATPLQRVEQRLQQELTSTDPRVNEVVRHGYRLGGKRLRPALVLLAGDAVGNLSDDHELLGVVVEMIHTATLVHDDVLDEAELRRHVDTVNARWGNEKSVLLGDFLFSHAFYLAATLAEDSAAACRMIGRSTNRVCHGELQQTLGEGDLSLSREAYFEIIEGKTAELCACCCRLGAHYAGANLAVTDALESYGRNLGMAFQIADDLLDLTGDAATTGKTTGADLAKQKMTLPLIYTRDSLVNGPRVNLEKWLAEPSEESLNEVRKLVEAVGGFAHAQQVAVEYAEKAIADLEVLQESETKQVLAMLAHFASRRSA